MKYGKINLRETYRYNWHIKCEVHIIDLIREGSEVYEINNSDCAR